MKTIFKFSAAIFLLLMLSTTHAATIEKCRAAEKDQAGFKLCVKTERRRAANQLHDLSPILLADVNEQTRIAKRKTRLKQYRTAQARHVRQRAALCRKQPIGVAREACEADSDFAHVERLQEFRSKPAPANAIIPNQ